VGVVELSVTAARRTAVSSVLLVALVAAVCSYCHMQHLAQRAGEEWRSWIIPLSVDGMLVASTLAIVDRRRAGLNAGWVPWMGLSLGILASLAANVAAARPDPIARVIAAWPPVALALSIETMVIVLRGTATEGINESTLLESRTSEPDRNDADDKPQDFIPAGIPPASSSPKLRSETPPAPSKPKRTTIEATSDSSSTKTPGRRALARSLGISEYEARKLVEQRKAEAPRNGHRVLEDAK
jgi:hypothetical protein